MTHQEFYTCEKKQQLQHIIDLIICSGDSKKIEELKQMYEEEHNTSFEFDYKRLDYSFLAYLTLYEAVKLYDNLVESAKNVLVSIIEVDHIHLKDLVAIHKTVNIFNTDVASCLAS